VGWQVVRYTAVNHAVRHFAWCRNGQENLRDDLLFARAFPRNVRGNRT